MQAPPLLFPLLDDELEELDDELEEVFPPPAPFPPFPPSPPPPPVGVLPNGVSSPSAQATKLNPQSAIVRRRMLACFTALCFEATRMPGCTQLPTLRFEDD